MNKKEFELIKKVFKSWLPLAVAIIALSGLIYIITQQNYRINANDPQIQIVEDVAAQIQNGQDPHYFIPRGKTDITKSLSAFIMLFDEKGKIIGSSASINGKDPIVPQGVFTTTKQKNQTRFTWQPQPKIRSAVVVNYYKNANFSGFVLVGRSLREAELRIDNLGKIVFLGMIITLAVSFFTAYFLQKIKSSIRKEGE